VSQCRLRILIIGSLGPNQDRILALSNRVERLVYAYTEFHPSLLNLNSKIPCVPLARRNLPLQVEYLIARHNINVLYSLLNAADNSTEATLELLDYRITIPIVRHYKEHPCVPTHEERRVLLETAGQIYINKESFDYFKSAYSLSDSSAHILDADMISEEYMTDDFARAAYDDDGEPHLLVAGGLSANYGRLDMRELCWEMNKLKVHVHLYGYMVKELDNRQITGDSDTKEIYKELERQLPYVHLHRYVEPKDFCSKWSTYDAGFMHSKVSSADVSAKFEEMNLPHRYSAYLAAGLPLVVLSEGQSAMKSLIEREGFGFAFSTYEELAHMLHDRATTSALRLIARSKRRSFSFDSSVHELIQILETYV
jgi:hypothetical protein